MKRFFILLIAVLLSSSLLSQNENGNNYSNDNGFKFEKNRLFTGGNLGLQFGTYTSIDVSPIIGYYFTNKFAAGIGAIYQYNGFKDNINPANSYNTNIYGANCFLRYYLFKNIFAHAEYEALNLETLYFDQLNRYSTPRFWVQSVLLGGGYRQPIGEHSSVNIMLLYNINETVDSPYSNPIIRMGFDIGL